MSEPGHPEQIDRDYIRLLQMMRRFVKEEFAVSVHISEDDAIAQLLRYAADSHNHVLKEMGKELEEFTRQSPAAESHETATPEEGHVRYYRGAAIIGDDHEDHSAETDKPQEKARPTRVYRGQVIN